MKLIDCDNSDMELWVNSTPAKNFIRELLEWRDAEDKAVHAKLSERAAGRYEMIDRVIRLFDGFNK